MQCVGRTGVAASCFAACGRKEGGKEKEKGKEKRKRKKKKERKRGEGKRKGEKEKKRGAPAGFAAAVASACRGFGGKRRARNKKE